MPDYYWHKDAVRWVDYNLGGYPVKVPHFWAERHLDRSSWEKARFQSMEKHLQPGMALYDIGSEQAQQSVIYARFVGGCGQNIILMEPCPQSWVNAKATWEANDLDTPINTWCGFVSDCTRKAVEADYDIGYSHGWPLCAYGDQLIDATKFRYETPEDQLYSTASTTLDDFVRDFSAPAPDALTIDVEGFEPRVIRGAIGLLKEFRPLLWISIHRVGQNNILHRFTGSDYIQEMYDILHGLGYRDETISEDHEIHTYWEPVEG